MDVMQLIKRCIDYIDPFYKELFLKLFVLTNIVYLYSTVNFLYSDHDVTFLTTHIGFKRIWWAGRFFQYAPIQILNGYLLPVINNILLLSAYIISGIMVCRLWNIPKNQGYYFLSVSFLLFVPYSMTWMFHSHGTFAMYLIPLYISLAGTLAKSDKWYSISAGSFLLFFAVSTYHPAINMICVIFCGKIILDFVSNEDFQNYHGYYKRLTIMSIIGGLLFCCSFLYIKYKGFLLENFYALQTNTFIEIFKNIPLIFYYSIKQFFVAQPYIEKNYKLILFSTLIFSYIVLSRKLFKNHKKKFASKIIVLSILFAGMIFATQFSNLISVKDSFLYARIAWCGLVFMSLFSFVVLCSSQSRIFNNLGVIILIVLLGINIVQVARIQKSWGESNKIETQRINRLIYSIQSHPSFNSDMQYSLYSCGGLSLPRLKFYPSPYHDGSNELHSSALTTYWNLSIILRYMEPDLKVNSRGRNAEALIAFLKKMDLPEFERYRTAIRSARAWPSKECVVILDSNILLFLDQESLAKVQDFLEQRLEDES